MKQWTLLFSVYIAMLAMIPCCAFDNCPDDKYTSEAGAHTSHEQGDEDACGTCSPFFNCGTCAVSFIATPAASFDFTLIATKETVPISYNPAIPEDRSGQIWQPPKIA